MVYSASHHMPQVVSGLLKDSIMPSLYKVVNLQSNRVVDLGPFKHTVDDALPLRKAALSIFATCLENLPGTLDISAFMDHSAQKRGSLRINYFLYITLHRKVPKSGKVTHTGPCHSIYSWLPLQSKKTRVVLAPIFWQTAGYLSSSERKG